MGGDSKRQKTTEMEKVEEKATEMEKVEEKATEMEKVEEKATEVDKAGSVDFAELRDDLLREAAKLVSDVPSMKLAIFFTPPSSSESDVSMYSFGYPSAKGVVKTFLEDNRSSDPAPAENEEEEDQDGDDAEDQDGDDAEDQDGDDAEDQDGSFDQGFWWEDAKQFESMNPEQLDAAYDRLARLRDRMILKLDAIAQGSGNQQDLLHKDDKAQPKP